MRPNSSFLMANWDTGYDLHEKRELILWEVKAVVAQSHDSNEGGNGIRCKAIK